MLRLSNGHSFSIACASGALAFGTGYWWERYGLIPLGIIDPSLFTIITKTITINAKKGNMRWWPPCVMPLHDGGAVNSVGLTNPGIEWLALQHRLGLFPINGLPTIVSIMADHKTDAVYMARCLNDMPQIKGIEVNVSCPNVIHSSSRNGLGQLRGTRIMSHEERVSYTVEVFRAVKEATKHPVGIKLGYPLDQIRQICDTLDGEADWFDLINTAKWSVLFPHKPSPLAKFGYEGGYSGPRLIPLARKALGYVTAFNADDTNRLHKLKTPIISGGGIGYTKNSKHGYAHEGIFRLQNGAAAVSIGTPFLTRPWRVNKIARDIIAWEANNVS